MMIPLHIDVLVLHRTGLPKCALNPEVMALIRKKMQAGWASATGKKIASISFACRRGRSRPSIADPEEVSQKVKATNAVCSVGYNAAPGSQQAAMCSSVAHKLHAAG